MADWRKWAGWNFIAVLLIFAGGLIYEWFWAGEAWILCAVFLGVLAVLAYPLWRLNQREMEKRDGLRSKWFFLFIAAGCAVLLMICCMESKDWMQTPHVMWLPVYIAFAVDGLLCFFFIWRWEKKRGAEFQKKVDSGGSVWKNMDMPKGKEK